MSDMNLTGPWPGPEGLIPEPPKNAADANRHTRNYLDSILIEERIIDAIEPDLHFDLWGKSFASPIMMPAFSNLNKVGENGRTPMEEYAQAAKELQVVNWVGMEPDDEFEKIAAVGAKTGRIIKPFKDKQEIYRQIDKAHECGAIAVGIDIDHVFGKDGKYDIVDGIELGSVTCEDLKNYVNYSKVPFVAKGVLSVTDALKCKEAGVDAIFISHHHGRMPFAIQPLAILPQIKKALAGTGMMIFVDCHIDDGYDAYKALALGADAVSVGRGILPGLLKEGTEGVIKKVNKMNEQLSELMGYTNVHNVNEFDPSVLYIYGHQFEKE